jgi:hypothetical protein
MTTPAQFNGAVQWHNSIEGGGAIVRHTTGGRSRRGGGKAPGDEWVVYQ